MTITEVNVMDEPGLYLVVSSSPVSYYVDTRFARPRVLRANPNLFQYATEFDETDGRWVELTDLVSLPFGERDGVPLAPEAIDWDDTPQWVIRVGARPLMACRDHNPDGSTFAFPWQPRLTAAIDRLEVPPADDDLAISPQDKIARYGVETW
ncbi:hypothetical protein [Demequina sp.]|uniref:hypothetical protein n=1 Tax=Demequina sp. TaxID=2050685 RepID=UPI003A87295E